MNNKFLQSIKVIALAMILILGTSHVWAFQDTTSAPTGGNVPAPVNTGPFDQVKEGFLRTNKFFQADQYLKAGNSLSIDSIFSSLGFPPGSILTSLLNGYSFAEKVMVSPWGMFGKLRAGATANNNTGAVSVNLNGLSVDEEANDHGAGLQIDVRGGSTGRDVLSLLAKEIGQNRVSSVLNKPFFQLWDTLNNKEGIFKGRSIQITEGGPARGKVLVSGDSDGTAVWANIGLSSKMLIPDIKIVEGQWKMTGDAQSRSLSCPADYVAIAVTCDSNHDAGYDTCALTPSLTAGTDRTIDIKNGGAPTGGIMSSNANQDSQNQMWLTCIRYQQYATPEITSNIPVTPVFDANGRELNDDGSPIQDGIKSWKDISLDNGSINESCSSWLTRNGKPATANTVRSANQFGETIGNCVYGKYADPDAIIATECRSVVVTAPAPTGFSPVSSCATDFSGAYIKTQVYE